MLTMMGKQPQGRFRSERLRMLLLLLALGLPAAMLAACSSGGSSSSGGGGTVSALEIPSRVTLSSAEGTSNSVAAKKRFRSLKRIKAFDDAGTDYTNEQKDTWLEDTDALDMVNDILGVVSESR